MPYFRLIHSPHFQNSPISPTAHLTRPLSAPLLSTHDPHPTCNFSASSPHSPLSYSSQRLDVTPSITEYPRISTTKHSSSNPISALSSPQRKLKIKHSNASRKHLVLAKSAQQCVSVLVACCTMQCTKQRETPYIHSTTYFLPRWSKLNAYGKADRLESHITFMCQMKRFM